MERRTTITKRPALDGSTGTDADKVKALIQSAKNKE